MREAGALAERMRSLSLSAACSSAPAPSCAAWATGSMGLIGPPVGVLMADTPLAALPIGLSHSCLRLWGAFVFISGDPPAALERIADSALALRAVALLFLPLQKLAKQRVASYATSLRRRCHLPRALSALSVLEPFQPAQFREAKRRSTTPPRALERASATSSIERYAERDIVRSSYGRHDAGVLRFLFASERIFCKPNRYWLLSVRALVENVLSGSDLGTLVLPLAPNTRV